MVGQSTHADAPDQITNLDMQQIAQPNFATRLDALADIALITHVILVAAETEYAHPAAFHGILRQTARFEEARRPQPLVDAQTRGCG